MSQRVSGKFVATAKRDSLLHIYRAADEIALSGARKSFPMISTRAPQPRMRLSLEHASAFSPYKPLLLPPPPAHQTPLNFSKHHRHQHHHDVTSENNNNSHSSDDDDSELLPSVCFVCVDMARDTPGSPMSRSAVREQLQAAGAAAATLTSGAYHAAAEHAAVTLHGNALQQKILEVMCLLFFQLFFGDEVCRVHSEAASCF